MARVLAIEPYFGGSHRAFLEGLVEHSRHDFHLLTQPARFWKWRMRGAAMTMADRARRLELEPDVVLASDMLSLAEFRALWPVDAPTILYMHENQLVYPFAQTDERDVHFGLTNITSCLAAQKILWNSSWHLESFLAAIPDLMDSMPDEKPSWLVESIRDKSVVVYPGLDLESIDATQPERDGGPPIVVWNHRWEHDKRPEVFFSAVRELADRGSDFRIAVMGEAFREKPPVFDEARERLGDRIVQFGFVPDRQDYLRWLRRGSVSVSTADQENFGMASIEAAYAGARPLWPDRLSYPELMPGRDHLYDGLSDLVDKLEAILRMPEGGGEDLAALHLGRFAWQRVIAGYDDLIRESSSGSRSQG
jgi:glycosyltransferase involved in cell wall biosynthesis